MNGLEEHSCLPSHAQADIATAKMCNSCRIEGERQLKCNYCFQFLLILLLLKNGGQTAAAN